MLPRIVSVSLTCTWPLSSSSSSVGGGEWCFLLRGVVCAVGAGLVEAIPSDRLGIEGESGTDVNICRHMCYYMLEGKRFSIQEVTVVDHNTNT